MHKINVLMAGPLPPNVGGMATVLGDLSTSKLSSQVQLVLFNTAKTTRAGRKLAEALFSKLGLWLDWWRLLKAKPNTIAHIHTCSGFTFFLDGILLSLAKLRGVPVVLHIHGASFDQFLDKLNPLLLALARWLCRRCAFIVVLSESWQTALRQRLGDLPFSVIANGVPILNAGVRPAHNPDELNILFLGNLSERKGVFDLLEVMPQVSKAVLHMVGGEEQPGFTAKISELIAEKQLQQRIKLHGIKAGLEKQAFFQNADIFILPSYAEGLPMSLLEAMMCGLPVIVSDVGGIPSVITDKENGLLITAGNHRKIAETLQLLINDPDLRQKIGQAAKQRCLAEFSTDAVVDKLLSLYTQIYPDQALV
jgi:glycosyltransferase involved in cell wall biosynthesis